MEKDFRYKIASDEMLNSKMNAINEGQTSSEPYATHLRLALAPWTVHFKCPGYIKEDLMHTLHVNVVKKTMERTKAEFAIRNEIGTKADVWREMGGLLAAAAPSLENRCFAPPNLTNSEYEGPSGQLIAANYSTLLKDLDRLTTVIFIARNVLTVGEAAQNMAAVQDFDQEIFKLVNTCVKVTARGFDGEPSSGEEDKWQLVITSFKRLLMTCLQFINNLIARNERRKLMLWVQLFDNPSDAVVENTFEDTSALMTSPAGIDYDEEFKKNLISISRGLVIQSEATSQLRNNSTEPISSPFILYIGKTALDVKRELSEQGNGVAAKDVATECLNRWRQLSSEQQQMWNETYTEMLEHYSKESKEPVSKAKINLNTTDASTQSDSAKEEITSKIKDEGNGVASVLERLNDLQVDSRGQKPLMTSSSDPSISHDADLEMDLDSASGARILQQGKDDLMRRLDNFSDQVPTQPIQDGDLNQMGSVPANAHAGPGQWSGLETSEEDDSEDEEYIVPGDEGRGLLTDVPLILSPTEIEVLPMIVMSGIVSPNEGLEGYGESPDEIAAIKNMHNVRCHLLLAQENGRNLLRELLIFVAAWDLREDELYFKFMVKIMEAILANSLLPFSYYAFKETKDIISPAQAVIMKLLTNMFRQRQSIPLSQPRLDGHTGSIARPKYPRQVDVQMVKFLLTEFRRSIIPQTCALIFLQGQIRAGYAAPDDFPLNLWDMERMYEGVYQMLELFAILTEADVWKSMMADWDVSSELVTLVKELDKAIPKGQLSGPPGRNTQHDPITQLDDYVKASLPPPKSPDLAAPPIAVERPYDMTMADHLDTQISGSSNPMPPGTFISDVGNMSSEPSNEEPSDFEWRNLKKLTVLVLSSLTWHTPKVQDQVRKHGGIYAILNCCSYDEHNPYIREHAIMCLRFLLQGNAANQDIVRTLEAEGVVPSEVLDQRGYETFMDARGQVGLRKKQSTPHDLAAIMPSLKSAAANHANGSEGRGKGHSPSQDSKDIAELVQQVMQNFPAGLQDARSRGQSTQSAHGDT